MPTGKKRARRGSGSGITAAIETMECRRLLSVSPMEFIRPDVFVAPPPPDVAAPMNDASTPGVDARMGFAAELSGFGHHVEWRGESDPGPVVRFRDGRGADDSSSANDNTSGPAANQPMTGHDVDAVPSWQQQLALAREAQALYQQLVGMTTGTPSAKPAIVFEQSSPGYSLDIVFLPGASGLAPDTGTGASVSGAGSAIVAAPPPIQRSADVTVAAGLTIVPPPAASPRIATHRSLASADRSSVRTGEEGVPVAQTAAPIAPAGAATARTASTTFNEASTKPQTATSTSAQNEGILRTVSAPFAAISGIMNPVVLREASTLAVSSGMNLLNNVVGGLPATTGVGAASTSPSASSYANTVNISVTGSDGPSALARIPTAIVVRTAAVAQAMLHVNPIDAVAAFSDALAAFANDSASLGMQPGDVAADQQARSNRAWAITAGVLAADAILFARWQARRSQKQQHASENADEGSLDDPRELRRKNSPFREGQPMIGDLALVE